MGSNMIGMLLIMAVITAFQVEMAIVKYYGKKYGKGGMFFNAIICLFATMHFIITDKGGLQFPGGIWLYGILNSLMYATGFYAQYQAFKSGSFALTTLLSSFAVVVSTFYGIAFLKEPTTFLTYIALTLVFLCLFFTNYQKEDASVKKKATLKWIIFVSLMVVSNAAIAIIGKMQHIAYGDTYSNEFLIISLAGASVFLFVFGLFFERDSLKSTIKHGFLYGAVAGIFSGINNLLVLMTYNYLPISFTYPVKAGLTVVVSFAVSVIFYKEKFRKLQVLGVIVGMIAVVLMNL